MQHYYDDLGTLNYEPPEKMVVELWHLLKGDERENPAQRSDFCETAIGLVYEHQCQGVGTQPSNWRNEEEETALGTILKRIFFDFIDKGYVPQEFLLVAWNVACTIQFEEATKGVDWGD